MSSDRPSILLEPDGVPTRFSQGTLPSYRHVPGLTPHPVKDPRGHLFGAEEMEPSSSCRALPGSWRSCHEYLMGIDLFNRAFLWEAHEVWEQAWIGAGKTTVPALFVQGLIQVSAALLRSHLGTPRGAHNLVAKAEGRFEIIEMGPQGPRTGIYMGIHLRPWRQSVEQYLTENRAVYPFLVPES